MQWDLGCTTKIFHSIPSISLNFKPLVFSVAFLPFGPVSLPILDFYGHVRHLIHFPAFVSSLSIWRLVKTVAVCAGSQLVTWPAFEHKVEHATQGAVHSLVRGHGWELEVQSQPKLYFSTRAWAARAESTTPTKMDAFGVTVSFAEAC